MCINSLPYSGRTTSPEATFQLAASFASFLSEGNVIFLQGEMGAGKTQFARGICAGLGFQSLYEVDSPTYTLVNHYDVGPGVDHLDLYRMSSLEELEEIGLDGIFDAPSIKLIEWPERLSDYPLDSVDFIVRLSNTSENERHITIQSQVEVFP